MSKVLNTTVLLLFVSTVSHVLCFVIKPQNTLKFLVNEKISSSLLSALNERCHDGKDDTSSTAAQCHEGSIGRKDVASSSLPLSPMFCRREAIIASMAGLSAEAAWRQAVNTAAIAMDSSTRSNTLPQGTIEEFESGRAVVIQNWLSPEEIVALRNDVQTCFGGGHFEKFVYSRNAMNTKKNGDPNSDTSPSMMKSFSPRKGTDGPFVNPDIGNFAIRQSLKARMAEVKAVMATQLHDRKTLADNIKQTHEMEYLRYGPGGELERHVDERHVELKRPNGSRLPKKPNATRRSVTWLVYLNDDDWDGNTDGGQLRLHERAQPSNTYVGARGPDLQVGWLKATSTDGEEPVFLDPLREGPENESCMLYTTDSNGNKRDLSIKPFANIALYLGGGDGMARKTMVDDPNDANRLHLIDAPKSLVSSFLSSNDPSGEDGGERIRDIVPKAGTLVMFDSVSLPHEVLKTNRERFAVQGWFHEKLYT